MLYLCHCYFFTIFRSLNTIVVLTHTCPGFRLHSFVFVGGLLSWVHSKFSARLQIFTTRLQQPIFSCFFFFPVFHPALVAVPLSFFQPITARLPIAPDSFLFLTWVSAADRTWILVTYRSLSNSFLLYHNSHSISLSSGRYLTLAWRQLISKTINNYP